MKRIFLPIGVSVIFLIFSCVRQRKYSDASGITYYLNNNNLFIDTMFVERGNLRFELFWENGILQNIVYRGEGIEYELEADYPNKGPIERRQYFRPKKEVISDYDIIIFNEEQLIFLRDKLVVEATVYKKDKPCQIRMYNSVYGAFHYALTTKESGFNFNEDSMYFDFFPHENQDSIWFQVDYNLESPEKAIFKFPITDKTTKYSAKYNDEEALVFKDNELSWDSLKVLW